MKAIKDIEIVSYEIMQVINGNETFIEDEITYENALKTTTELIQDNPNLGFKIVQVVRETLDEFFPVKEQKIESSSHFIIQLLIDRVNYKDFLTLSSDTSEEVAKHILSLTKNTNPNKTYRLIKKESSTTIL